MSTIDKLKRIFSQKKPAQAIDVTPSSSKTEFDPSGSHTDVSRKEEAAGSVVPLVEHGVAVEFYSLNEPYASARIIKDSTRGTLTYLVEEPALSDDEVAQMARLKDLLTQVLDVKAMDIESKEAAERYLQTKIRETMDRYGFKMGEWSKEKILYYMTRDHLGFGKIDAMMHDPLIEDISCDGENIRVYIWHRKYESIPTNILYAKTEELDSFALRLAYLCGRHVSIAQPMLDASLPEGSRIHLTYGSEVTRRGSTFSIRKFKLDPLTIIDLIDLRTLSAEMAAYFWYAVENRVSILVSGGIAAGKTTTLNCLSMFIRPNMKIVSIEDTPELNLPHENWVPSVTRSHFGLGTESADIGLFDLLQASLRQRPDYIIVGEVRGSEAFTLFQAISTGHLGMATIHGESVDAVVYRLESEPMNIPRTLISGIDLITVQKRVASGGTATRRTVTTSEIVGLDPRSREILTNEVYRWNSAKDSFDFTGRSYLLERIAERSGMSLEDVEREIHKRAGILEWMSKESIRSYKTVSDIIRRFYENPEWTLKEAGVSD